MQYKEWVWVCLYPVTSDFLKNLMKEHADGPPKNHQTITKFF